MAKKTNGEFYAKVGAQKGFSSVSKSKSALIDTYKDAERKNDISTEGEAGDNAES